MLDNFLFIYLFILHLSHCKRWKTQHCIDESQLKIILEDKRWMSTCSHQLVYWLLWTNLQTFIIMIMILLLRHCLHHLLRIHIGCTSSMSGLMLNYIIMDKMFEVMKQYYYVSPRCFLQ